MIKVENSGIINRPIEEVFAFVGDLTNAPQWQSGLVEVRRTTDGPLRVGTTHTFVRNFMGRKMEANNEYIAYEPNKRITFKSTSGPVRFEFSYLFESTAEGTKLTGKMQMQATGLLRLAEPLIAASLRRETKAAAGVLKDLLENPAAAISPHSAVR
jgi:Polyketide cyclase / dehydrase and lipid transport.